MAGAIDEPESPYVLGGASFGGMVALEMSKHLRPSALALIGSAFCGREVRRWLRAVELVGHTLPTRVIDACRLLAPLAAPIVSSGSRVDPELFLDMLRGTPTEFIRWASRAIMRWKWEGEIACPVYRLHGSRDRIICPPRAGGVSLVEGAGHVISLSHPEETNRFLADILARHGARVTGHAADRMPPEQERAERPPGRSVRGGRSVE
jgi:pimeloyl-ACP methyl ester carboxylesterase